MLLGQLDIHMVKNEIGPLPQLYSKINSKWIIELNVKAKLWKSEIYISVNPHDFGLGNGFLNMASSEQPKQK